MFRVLLLAAVLCSLQAHPQVDPGKLDSLSRAIAEKAGATRKWQDSFLAAQDSARRSHNKAFGKGEPERRGSDEAKENKGIAIPLVLLIAIAMILALLYRRRKTKP
ncbi:MAG TPA: hypothetical protein VFR58_13360 [Flavisolibacter sp.]|nr:hypothetical protein [Flavisolibacter sp.]